MKAFEWFFGAIFILLILVIVGLFALTLYWMIRTGFGLG